jgi:hypothetical protein
MGEVMREITDISMLGEPAAACLPGTSTLVMAVPSCGFAVLADEAAENTPRLDAAPLAVVLGWPTRYHSPGFRW